MRDIQMLYNKRQVLVGKAHIIIGCLALLYAVAGFAVDFLPVDAFQSPSNNSYLKIVPTDESSLDWSQFRLPALVVGAILVVISKFVGSKN
ncbi:hypothetical protein [Hahella sp. HN01]|uniref:hypothetical protein n=1 Tax=Hahella sp. HN01 TaxID=2847262 RepID=UPI001C1EEC31|nr:hypothetical protein [Hahella sp. HN01]MBU6956064.1 hypothetical protein [Hahella sp. HN01]